MSIWITNMPLTPSVNDSLDVAIVRKKNQTTGRVFTGGQFRSTKSMIQFKKQILQFRDLHSRAFAEIRDDCEKWITQGFMLKVDVFVVFHVDRVFSNPNKKVLRLDGNNRLKGQLDAIAKCLDIDDKFFFGGDCEKVTCDPGEKECAMVRITPMRPRTVQEIRRLMMSETASPSPPTPATPAG